MAGTIVVDRIESDASYASTINVAGQITFSNTVNFGVFAGTAPVAGFYLPTTNNLAFTTASTERMRITSAGNVGIGTSSPSTQLQMNSGAATYSDQLRIRNTNFGNADIGVGSGIMAIATDMSNIAFYTSSSLGTTGSALPNNERMRIDSSGNIGIGTTELSLFNSVGGVTRLAVCGSSASTDILGNTGASISIINTDTTANNTAGLHFARADTDDSPNYAGASIVAQFLDTQVAGQYPKGLLAFLTSTTANAAPSEKMRIDSSGNVGIGTASPLAKLDIFTSSSTSQRFSTNVSQLNFVHRAVRSVSVAAYATIFTITPSANSSNWMRGSVKLSAAGHTSGVANGLLQDAVYYIDMDTNTMTTGSLVAGTSSGTGAPVFRIQVSGSTWIVQLQSSNGTNTFDGLVTVEFLIPATAGNSRTFTIT